MELPRRRYDLDTARLIGYRALERADAEQALQATNDHGGAQRSTRDQIIADRARADAAQRAS